MKDVSLGFALWLMGSTSSRKKTLVELLVEGLCENGVTAINNDGYEVHDQFRKAYGFKPSDLLHVVSTFVYGTNKACDVRVKVVVSAFNRKCRRDHPRLACR